MVYRRARQITAFGLYFTDENEAANVLSAIRVFYTIFLLPGLRSFNSISSLASWRSRKIYDRIPSLVVWLEVNSVAYNQLHTRLMAGGRRLLQNAVAASQIP